MEAAKAVGRFAMRAASESGARKFDLSSSVAASAARRDAGGLVGRFVVRRTKRKRERPKPPKGRP